MRPPEQWTVNDPLDFSKDGPKELEAFLIRNLPEGEAHYHAENVGLSLSALRDDPNPRVRWRDFLRVAARQGLLRRFLDEIISKPEYAGLASTLRQWL